MKKKFESAEVRVIQFEAMDIMTASRASFTFGNLGTFTYDSENGKISNTEKTVSQIRDWSVSSGLYNGGDYIKGTPKKELAAAITEIEGCISK